MHFSASLMGALIIIAIICQASGLETVIGLYGETIEVPCNNGAANPNAFMTKWKYEDRGNGDLLVKQMDGNVSVTALDDYKDRVSMGPDSSLHISAATLDDQKVFICMVVEWDIQEYPVQVVVHKAPSAVGISEKAEEVEIGILTELGKCSAQDAYPAADITWFKNGEPLVSDGKGIFITTSVNVDPTTGFSTTSSILQYTAEKDDTDARFACGSQHLLTIPETFTVTYPPEKVSLRVIFEGETVTEGDNVTLTCEADGNPPPPGFNFHIKGEVVKLEDKDTYVLTDVTRDNSGEYKCSLIDDDTMVASENITVNYLDMTLSPCGEVTERASESFAPALQIDASGDTEVSWTKDNKKLDKPPEFEKLTFSDSGFYECEVTMGALIQKASFELIVEGTPVIQKLTKQRGEDGQYNILVCEVEGFPKPSVAWTINGTLPDESPFVNGSSSDESPFVNSRITHKLTIEPVVNVTVSCIVSNYLGQDTNAINVSSIIQEERMDTMEQDQSDENDSDENDSDENDSSTLVVSLVVVGLLLVTVVVGLMAYMLRNSKQGSCKTGVKEDVSSEESKKLEEKLEEKVEEKLEVEMEVKLEEKEEVKSEVKSEEKVEDSSQKVEV